MMLIAPEQAQWQSVIAPLESLGYLYWAEKPRPDRMFFVKGMPPFGRKRSHHVHVRLPQDSERELGFRDYLRLHPTTAAQYAALKQELAARFPSDREAYTQAKTSFIEVVLQQARTTRDIDEALTRADCAVLVDKYGGLALDCSESTSDRTVLGPNSAGTWPHC